MPAIRVEVKVDTSKIQNLITSQIPFAVALSLTKVAQDAQQEIRRQLPQRFTIRNNFVSSGIRIIPATKTSLESAVFSKDDFVTLQEVGGLRRPVAGSHIAVPEAVHTNKPGIISHSNRPRQLLEKPRTFRALIGWDRRNLGRTRQEEEPDQVALCLEVYRSSTCEVRVRLDCEEGCD